MIKAVLFDFGNVLATFDNMRFCNAVEQYSSLSAQEIYDALYSSPLPKEYEHGRLTSEDFYMKVCGLCNVKSDFETFANAYADIFTPIESNIDLLAKLKGKYLLGLLSNTSEIDYERAIKHIRNFDLFDEQALSYVSGVMKPDAKVYEDLFAALDVKPEECVFIDDLKDNIDAACEMGVVGVHYTGEKPLEDLLREVGIVF